MTIRPPSAEPGGGLPADLEDPGEVGVDHRLPLLQAHLLDRAVADDAGVVHHDVQVAEAGRRRVEQAAHRRRVAHVRRQGRRPRAQRRGRLLGPGAVGPVIEVVHHHVGAGLVQAAGHGGPQPLACPGDDGRASR